MGDADSEALMRQARSNHARLSINKQIYEQLDSQLQLKWSQDQVWNLTDAKRLEWLDRHCVPRNLINSIRDTTFDPIDLSKKSSPTVRNSQSSRHKQQSIRNFLAQRLTKKKTK